MDRQEQKFYWQWLDDTNFGDLGVSLANQQLVGIVSEKAGGIIAYALSPGHAADIVTALEGQCTSDDSTNHQGDTCPVHEAV